MEFLYKIFKGDMGDLNFLDHVSQNITDVVILAGLVGDPITKKYPNESQQINDVSVKKCMIILMVGIAKLIFISTCSAMV